MLAEDFSTYLTNEQIIQRARKNLAQGPWDYLAGASESETTQRRNRLAFDKLAFRPRVLVDVRNVDATTNFIGHKIRIPVMLAPIGSLQTFHPEGGAAVSAAAGKFGTMHILSSVTLPTLEETMAASDFAKSYQLYIHGDWEWTKDMISRVKSAGYKGFCVTVDTANYSRRERPMLSRWTPVSRRNPTDPQWQASVTWESIDRIKAEAGLPFMLKGIATAEDAKIAVDHGVDVIWVSNHGGRQLDHGQGTMEMLPEIVEAVDGKAEIVLDGGVQRGSDVIKAIALGAKAVAVGKMQGWGLAAGGTEGIYRVLEILEEEIKVAMGLMGVTSIDQLGTDYVCPADPVVMPHEMSSWVNKRDDRIL
ncbi:MAG: alpha-hydroxy-acid oxidizing protein [SAR202 cluster bacterium]|nr:alpha-hydroxy-acid oxidizing protein [SAR202 cluster bacterium]HAE32243.1 alpha-hydroxy-acid oxidizing enzyme [Dehalococcoidia bacterium]